MANSLIDRPVDDQGKTRPESTEFVDFVYESLDKVIMLASQAINLDLEKFSGLEIVYGVWGNRARTLHHMEISHNNRDIGMAEEALARSDIGSEFQERGGPASLRYAGASSSFTGAIFC